MSKTLRSGQSSHLKITFHPPMAYIGRRHSPPFGILVWCRIGFLAIAFRNNSFRSCCVHSFLRGILTSTSLSEKRHGRSLPSAVSLMRLQVGQKWWLRALIKPISPFADSKRYRLAGPSRVARGILWRGPMDSILDLISSEEMYFSGFHWLSCPIDMYSMNRTW